jgi:hypothetical protein
VVESRLENRNEGDQVEDGKERFGPMQTPGILAGIKQTKGINFVDSLQLWLGAPMNFSSFDLGWLTCGDFEPDRHRSRAPVVQHSSSVHGKQGQWRAYSGMSDSRRRYEDGLGHREGPEGADTVSTCGCQ